MSRSLAWDACINVRDLGGLPAEGGRSVRTGALVRSDAPVRLTAAGWSALVAHGVRTVVDLRAPDEAAAQPLVAPAPVSVAWTPAFGETPVSDLRWMVDGAQALPSYVTFLERFRAGFAAGVAAVADAPPAGVVVNCQAGRDRTGIVVALALELAGVPRGEIVEDYGQSREPFLVHARAKGPAREAWFADFHSRGWAQPETLAATFAHLDERYGGPAAYVGDASLAGRLRERLLS
jgi:protein-tyrosine phosphatase